MILELLKKYWLYMLFVLTIVGLVLYFTTCNPVQTNETIYIHDTTIQTRYENSIDTVRTFKEVFTIKEVKADTVRYQKVDTLFIDEQKSKDLILGFEKKGTDLTIWALNMNKELLKEEKFMGVYNNFSAYSANDRVHVETRLWYWNKIQLGYEHRRNVRDLSNLYEHNVDIMAGVNWKNRFYFDAGIEYKLIQKELELKLKTKVLVF